MNELLALRRLAVTLLAQEDGISEEAYSVLRPLLVGDNDITDHVNATDGRFYLPEDYIAPELHVGIGYLEAKANVIFGSGAATERDNNGQILVYTGLMETDTGLADYEASDDDSENDE